MRNVRAAASIKGMSGWWFAAVASTTALAFVVVAHSRARRRLRSLATRLAPRCSIGDLGPGRFRVVGVVRASEGVSSAIDGALCPFLEAVEYRTVGGAMPVARAVEASRVTYPFVLDDGSGALVLDPAELEVEASVALEDGGFTTERRIRDGEEVELVATFARTGSGGPYREGHDVLAPVPDGLGRPRLSFRTEHGMASAPDEIAWALRGLAALLLATAAVFLTFAHVIG